MHIAHSAGQLQIVTKAAGILVEAVVKAVLANE